MAEGVPEGVVEGVAVLDPSGELAAAAGDITEPRASKGSSDTASETESFVEVRRYSLDTLEDAYRCHCNGCQIWNSYIRSQKWKYDLFIH